METEQLTTIAKSSDTKEVSELAVSMADQLNMESTDWAERVDKEENKKLLTNQNSEGTSDSVANGVENISSCDSSEYEDIESSERADMVAEVAADPVDQQVDVVADVIDR